MRLSKDELSRIMDDVIDNKMTIDSSIYKNTGLLLSSIHTDDLIKIVSKIQNHQLELNKKKSESKPISSTERFKGVLFFMEKGELPVNTTPTLPSEEVFALRLKLLREEVNELEDAYKDGDIVEVLDAIADIQYVLDGATIEFGLTKLYPQAMRRVIENNNSKVRNGVIKDNNGKIMKPEGYVRVKLHDLFS